LTIQSQRELTGGRPVAGVVRGASMECISPARHSAAAAPIGRAGGESWRNVAAADAAALRAARNADCGAITGRLVSGSLLTA
jgi:hypothetical protein